MILLCIFIPLAFVVAFMLIQIHYSLKEERKLKKRMDQFPKAKKINNYSPTKK